MQVTDDLDYNGHMSNPFFNKLLQNKTVKAEVLRKLAESSSSPSTYGQETGTQYSGTTFMQTHSKVSRDLSSFTAKGSGPKAQQSINGDYTQ